MIGDSGTLWEYVFFPLLLFVVGFINLVMEVWPQILLLVLIALTIWFTRNARKDDDSN